MKNLLTTILILFSPIGSAFGKLDYRKDIAPILRDYCAGCHNDDDYEGALTIETFQSLMEGGETEEKAIIVPGKADESYLFQTMVKTAKPAMPPKREPQLSPEQIDLVRQWIEEGAEGPKAADDLSTLSTLSVPDIAPSDSRIDPITAMEYSPDGKTLAVALYGKIELRAVENGRVLLSLETGEGKVNAIHFSPDGRNLVAATGTSGLFGVALLYDLDSGEVIRRFGEESHRDILFDAEFSPDGELLATAGYDRIIRLWEVSSGKYLRNFPSHNGAVYDLAFSPDGKVLASASGDFTGKIWKVETGERLDTLNQPQAEQFRIDFTPDGRFIIAVGGDNRIRLWRFVSRERPKINPVARAKFGHEDTIVEMAVSADGKWLATTSADRALKKWSLPGLEPLGVADEQSDLVSALAFTPGSNEVTVSRLDGSVQSFGMTPAGETEVDSSGLIAESSSAHPGVEGGKEIIDEVENGPAPEISLGTTAKGVIGKSGDTDDFVLEAKQGQTWIFETNANRAESKLDSHLAILDSEEKPVERVVLQATRDSWLTFRGKDSMASTDFRVHNWMEMDLNEYLYLNGEVVKLWHYPRGPDSGFLVYPGFGDRHNYFETTALSHPLGQPCYIVRALPAGAEPSPNGLPVYRLFYENDDESSRSLGKDSKITFHVPADGIYRIRVRDVSNAGGEGFGYELSARLPKPDFDIKPLPGGVTVSAGGGLELAFSATREDGFKGAIRIHAEGLPANLSLPEKIVIEPNQYRAFTVLGAGPDFAGVSGDAAKEIELIASAIIDGRTVKKSLGSLGEIAAVEEKNVFVRIEADGESGKVASDGTLELTLHPGETITAKIMADRLGMKDRISFGKEDSGRNLPHGVYVDNIGLSGLMIPEGKSEQHFFITAASWVPETTREFHVRTTGKEKQASQSVRLIIRKPDALANSQP